MSTKQRRTPAPETLGAKRDLAAIVHFDERLYRKHHIVYAFILDWFHSKYGDALASVRHIVAQLKERDPRGRGLYTGDVHSALTDLTQWGYLFQEKGSGRRASRYVPNWSLAGTVLERPNATATGDSVLVAPNASVLVAPNATGDSVLVAPNQDPSTVTRLQDEVTGSGSFTDSAAPSAPPAPPAHAADGVVPALEGFEALWLAYGLRKDKKGARVEFDRLAPTGARLERMVESAAAWRDSWSAQNKPDAPRMQLRTWLRDEQYDCDPPTGWRGKQATPRQDPAPVSAPPPATPRFTAGTCTILGAATPEGEHGQEVRVTFQPDNGAPAFQRIFQLDLGDGPHFAKVVSATGLAGVDDTDELHGRRLFVDGANYRPIAANDNGESRAA